MVSKVAESKTQLDALLDTGAQLASTVHTAESLAQKHAKTLQSVGYALDRTKRRLQVDPKAVWKAHQAELESSVVDAVRAAAARQPPKATCVVAANVRQLVHRDLQKHSSDAVGMHDYAAAQLGGTIVTAQQLTSPSYDPEQGGALVSSTMLHILGFNGAFAPPDEVDAYVVRLRQ